VKALTGFLMTQRQKVWLYNVTKLHRPRILDAFLADIVYMT